MGGQAGNCAPNTCCLPPWEVFLHSQCSHCIDPIKNETFVNEANCLFFTRLQSIKESAGSFDALQGA